VTPHENGSDVVLSARSVADLQSALMCISRACCPSALPRKGVEPEGHCVLLNAT
jgi:hypothetical protein